MLSQSQEEETQKIPERSQSRQSDRYGRVYSVLLMWRWGWRFETNILVFHSLSRLCCWPLWRGTTGCPWSLRAFLTCEYLLKVTWRGLFATTYQCIQSTNLDGSANLWPNKPSWSKEVSHLCPTSPHKKNPLLAHREKKWMFYTQLIQMDKTTSVLSVRPTSALHALVIFADAHVIYGYLPPLPLSDHQLRDLL